MNSMLSAIKGRRGGMMEEQAPMQEEMAAESGGGVDMKSLVQALSPEQKNQLLSLLVGQGKSEGPTPDKIEEGAMGPGEAEEIEESLGDGHESEDEIAESFLASSDKMRAEAGDKPRNLSERVKFGLATKLKNKGK